MDALFKYFWHDFYSLSLSLSLRNQKNKFSEIFKKLLYSYNISVGLTIYISIVLIMNTGEWK